MNCPYCPDKDTRVLESRDHGSGAIRRRRECVSCSRRFTTYERIEEQDIIVIKKNGSKERFSREKVLKGLSLAFEKRPIGEIKIQKMVTDIERKLRSRGKFEVTSRQIGNTIIKKIKSADPVAYLRFASVYKEFKDIDEFKDELTKLKL